jgi:hypothetical protein
MFRPEKNNPVLKLPLLLAIALISLPGVSRAQSEAAPRVIEIVADHDSHYRIDGHADPVITVTAGEPLLFRITAIKAKERNRDGSVHGFMLMNTKDQSPVPGWDFSLHPGKQEIAMNAPEVPGEYEVVCTVMCSPGHDDMRMKFVVLPK